MELDLFKLCFCVLIVAAVTETCEKVKPWFSLFIIVAMTIWAYGYFFHKIFEMFGLT